MMDAQHEVKNQFGMYSLLEWLPLSAETLLIGLCNNRNFFVLYDLTSTLQYYFYNFFKFY